MKQERIINWNNHYKFLEVYRELERILNDIKADRDISWGDTIFLQEHQAEIKKYFTGEPVLWEWAEIPEAEWNNK